VTRWQISNRKFGPPPKPGAAMLYLAQVSADASSVLILYGKPPRLLIGMPPRPLRLTITDKNRESYKSALRVAAARWTGKDTRNAIVEYVGSGPEITRALQSRAGSRIGTVVFVMETYIADTYTKRSYLLPQRGNPPSGVDAQTLVSALPASVKEVYFMAYMGVLLKGQAERAEEDTPYSRKYVGSDKFQDLVVYPQDPRDPESAITSVDVVDQGK
jgi:hypothetical protein